MQGRPPRFPELPPPPPPRPQPHHYADIISNPKRYEVDLFRWIVQYEEGANFDLLTFYTLTEILRNAGIISDLPIWVQWYMGADISRPPLPDPLPE